MKIQMAQKSVPSEENLYFKIIKKKTFKKRKKKKFIKKVLKRIKKIS